MINKDLAKLREIPLEDQVHIEETQKLLAQWVEEPWKYFDCPQHALEVVEITEYALQRLWRFPENKDFHTWWMRLAGNRCPKMDNEERWGTGRWVINGNCPYFGSNKATSWDDPRFDKGEK